MWGVHSVKVKIDILLFIITLCLKSRTLVGYWYSFFQDGAEYSPRVDVDTVMFLFPMKKLNIIDGKESSSSSITLDPVSQELYAYTHGSSRYIVPPKVIYLSRSAYVCPLERNIIEYLSTHIQDNKAKNFFTYT